MARGVLRKLFEKADAFTARFKKELAAICARRGQTLPMIDPCDVSGGGEECLELRVPNRPFQRQESSLKIAEPIGVKIDMLCFILEKERARLFQNRIARSRFQQPVIGGPD